MSNVTDHATKRTPQNALLGHSDLPWYRISAYITSELRRELMSYDTVKGEFGVAEVSRYGCLSHIMAETPVVVFDHPALVFDPEGRFSTAFTDGARVYVNAYFALHLLELDAASEMVEMTTLGVLVHELSHIARGHLHGRLEGAAPHHILNYVFDACINASNLYAYDHLRGKGAEGWVATTPEAIEYFKHMGEEQALREFLENPEAFAKKAGTPLPQEGNGKGGHHFGSTREFAEFLEQNGLHDAMEKMGIPPSSDHDAHRELTRELGRRMSRAAQATARDMASAKRVGAKTPGGHIDESFIEQVDLVHNPRLAFKLRLRKALPELGRARFGYHDEVPDPVRFTPPAAMGFNSSPYLPGYTQIGRPRSKILVVVDTSGSMGNKDLSACFTEIFNLARHRGGPAPEVIIHCADTALRGQPITLTSTSRDRLLQQNAKQVSAVGRGGTSYASVLGDLSRLYARDFAKGKIAAVLYFGDLEDAAPSRSVMGPRAPRVIFVAPEDRYSKTFASAVSGWAEVVPIRPGEVLTITDDDLPPEQPRPAAPPAAASPEM